MKKVESCIFFATVSGSLIPRGGIVFENPIDDLNKCFSGNLAEFRIICILKGSPYVPN